MYVSDTLLQFMHSERLSVVIRCPDLLCAKGCLEVLPLASGLVQVHIQAARYDRSHPRLSGEGANTIPISFIEAPKP